jgi:diadenosine tetraphosphate (Ap4A) HIT family hydrolase
MDKTAPESIIFENDILFVCLANYPITAGHTIVFWKKQVEDLHLLSRSEYEYLMDTVDTVRNVLLKIFNVEKVYLLYLDELKQVHWHLVPRYNEMGFNMLAHIPIEATDFPMINELRIEFKERMK